MDIEQYIGKICNITLKRPVVIDNKYAYNITGKLCKYGYLKYYMSIGKDAAYFRKGDIKEIKLWA